MYTVLKFIHIFGVVLFVGNIIVTALWKTRADRSGNLATVVFAQRTVVLADWAFTLPGVLLILIGGYAMAVRRPFPLHGLVWLEWGQGLFYVAALIWLLVLVPTQRRLVDVSAAALRSGVMSPEFRRLSRRWAMWGGIATLLPLIVLFLMVAKS
jgi:uncharacterized membrane protein